MQKTFVIFKPDCMEQKHVGTVIDRFEKAGFEIVGAKLIQLSSAVLREHYAHQWSQRLRARAERIGTLVALHV